jgi:lipopolysaccharide biosynthesis glycosyltransferase
MAEPLIRQLTLAEIGRAESPPGWDLAGPTLLCASDDRYAMPLAAALASAVANLDPADPRPLQLVLLDGGMAPATWDALAATLERLALPTLRVMADRQAVAHLNVSHHISHTAYFRLLSSRWLPAWISRVIYLDCDVIVLGDLRELWRASWQDVQNGSGAPNEVWAVPDVACPYVDPRVACPEFAAFSPYFAALHPVRNYRELGLDPQGMYFNSGVMVLDLAAWRRADRSQQLMDCLRRHAADVWCWDQYALNVVFAGRWGALPLAWNFGAHAYDYAAVPRLASRAPLLPDQYEAMWRAPQLIHFTTEIKPWHYYSFHPKTELFYHYLGQTAWAQWRPIRPGFKTWWHVQTFRWQKRLIALTRRWSLG